MERCAEGCAKVHRRVWRGSPMQSGAQRGVCRGEQRVPSTWSCVQMGALSGAQRDVWNFPGHMKV